MTAPIVAVIPARYDSSRFPGKVLFQFRGKSLLHHLYQELNKCKKIGRLLIATDDRRVRDAVNEFGGEVVMTSRKHRSGSDRVAEVVADMKANIVVNIQADNFGLKAAVLDRTIGQFESAKEAPYGTMAFRLTSDEELFDPNMVKVVLGKDNQALWFSRFPLPYVRDIIEDKRVEQHKFYGHIGVYLFRKASLEQYAGWKQGLSEKAESLEQLRILENGGSIRAFLTRSVPIAIEVPEDIGKLEHLYR